MSERSNTPETNSTRPGETPSLWKQMLRSAVKLSLFTLAGVTLLLLAKQLTDEPIREAERANLLATINQLLPADQYTNDLLRDTLQVTNPKVFGTDTPVTIYRARRDGQPVGLVLTTVAPDGYSGDIHIMLAVYHDGRVAGVRVLKHKETPGLGDKVERRKSDWILSFNARQLTAENAQAWAVRKDGGQFDQFTGATITPRAVVKAIRKTLNYVRQKGDSLYE
ncbi:MAG: electron transport complex subunit RsxG [Hydrogenovibrio sp.]